MSESSITSASGSSQTMPQESETNPHSIADYLAQLLKDKKTVQALPNVFQHVARLLDEEISRVRASLFQINGSKREPLDLPDEEGPVVALSEKVYVPYKEHPDFNFVGRILGPRGMTAKQLEQETGCKIMVRGRGSMRDKKKLRVVWTEIAIQEDTFSRRKLKNRFIQSRPISLARDMLDKESNSGTTRLEAAASGKSRRVHDRLEARRILYETNLFDQSVPGEGDENFETNEPFLYTRQEDSNRGKPNWEHLNDELHVLITVEDTENRAHKKLERAVEEIKKLLIPSLEQKSPKKSNL
ncbi:unnamed protein product [Cyprideis torosa]|uniref:Uncharacterized protein n=1 Tax=Cyprideis torosa TaxID=163714 RepID=A0A7R8WBW9_9CRUS|nr:unnamed protein product [Cyprideis torosa]CAG0886891.1 unnamed protein product [Cyprideis torosa]